MIKLTLDLTDLLDKLKKERTKIKATRTQFILFVIYRLLLPDKITAMSDYCHTMH